jgi:hypothetical protein
MKSCARMLPIVALLAGLAPAPAGQAVPDREMQQLTVASEGASHFGWAVAIDGAQAAVTDRFDNHHIQILGWDGFDWSFQQTIDGPPFAADSSFGRQLVLKGDLLVAGRDTYIGAGQFGTGNVHVYRRLDGSFVSEAVLTPPDGEERFGASLALVSEDLLAVGSSSGYVHPNGCVSIFQHEESGWTLAQQLLPAELAPKSMFGWSLATVAGRIIAGAPEDAPPGAQQAPTGSVRVFAQAGGSWVEQQVLHGLHADADFGRSISANGEWLAVSAPWQVAPPVPAGSIGAVHLYRFVDGQYVAAQVIGLQAGGSSAEASAQSVALEGDTLLVGVAYATVGSATWAGRVFVYCLQQGSWVADGELTPSSQDSYQALGFSLAMTPGCALVGQPGSLGVILPGAAQFYRVDAPGFSALGHELGPDNAQPVLQVLGAPEPHAALELRLGATTPGVPAWLFLGPVEDLQPLKGGLLVPQPLMLLLLGVTDGAGHLSMSAHWPEGAEDLTVVAQAWVHDEAWPWWWWRASNGIQLHQP